ncbi:hypothetical protein [Fibrella aquatilis]|uniref:Uncharacterized protein n=1 Tax=Fibrella aquatilis TaxID=2817059 RepID=A0A939G2M9_9BACT|nr:hypothetical protein [Fibrella aquatilis]MBO0931212.1 hypothetical protein [Fibrella aquatilis]
MNARHQRVQKEVVRLLEPGHRLGWSPVYPTWFIRGMRVQQLNERSHLVTPVYLTQIC